MRYFLNRPQAWVLEYAEFGIVWFTFLSAAWILKREGHVKVDILVNQLSRRNQALLGSITSIIGVILCFSLTVYGVQVTWYSFQKNLSLFTYLRTPQGPVYAIIPAGGFLLFIQFLRRGYGYFVDWRGSPQREREA